MTANQKSELMLRMREGKYDIELMQADDDSWTVHYLHRLSGQLEVLKIGRLSKQQAINEISRRYSGKVIRIWDKTVLTAISKGEAKIVQQ